MDSSSHLLPIYVGYLLQKSKHTNIQGTHSKIQLWNGNLLARLMAATWCWLYHRLLWSYSGYTFYTPLLCWGWEVVAPHWSVNYILTIYYPTISLVSFIFSSAIGAKFVGIGGVSIISIYMGSREESINTTIIIIGHSKVLWINTKILSSLWKLKTSQPVFDTQWEYWYHMPCL